MSDQLSGQRRWIGRVIIAISILHTIFAFAVFWPQIQEMVATGLFNSVEEDPIRGAVAWFFFAGMFMASTGLAVDLLERNNVGNTLRATGIFLLLTTILGIVMMPASGFWLILVPSIAMIWKRPKAN